MSSLAHLLSQARNYDVERPRLVGVYFLMRHGDVFYIGQSTNIEARIATHRADRRMREVDAVFWIDAEENELDGLEGALLRHLRPIGNTKRAFGDPKNDASILAQFGITVAAGVAETRPRQTRENKYAALGATINAHRVAAGLTQDDLAAKLGLSKTAVSKWEIGRSRPDRDICEQVSKVLNAAISFDGSKPSESVADAGKRRRVHKRSAGKVSA